MSATVVMCEWSPEIAGNQRNPQSVSSVAASPNHDFISDTKYAGYSDQNPAPAELIRRYSLRLSWFACGIGR